MDHTKDTQLITTSQSPLSEKPEEASSACALSLAFLIYTQAVGKCVWKQFHGVEGSGLFFMLAQLWKMGRSGETEPFHSCALQNELTLESSWLK